MERAAGQREEILRSRTHRRPERGGSQKQCRLQGGEVSSVLGNMELERLEDPDCGTIQKLVM